VLLPPYAEKGCWARLYEKAGFHGAVRQLEGPADVGAIGGTVAVVPDMGEAGIQPLFSEIGSVVIGPRARLTGYLQPLFETPTLVLGPGGRLADTSSADFYGRVRSFRLRCAAA
jgi:hypothetical protein